MFLSYTLIISLLIYGVIQLNICHGFIVKATYKRKSLTSNNNQEIRFNTRLYHSDGEADEYKKWLCPSCNYVYNEENGFKKRYPPGTRWRDIEVFLW